MAKKTYMHLLATLFDYLILEWGDEGRLIFKDQGDIQYRHDLGYICYKLNPETLNGHPHTLGLKKLNFGGLAGPEGLSLAYWTETPLSESEPRLILNVEKRAVGNHINYSLVIRTLQSFNGQFNGFDIAWGGAEQVLGIIDRARKLLKSEEWLKSTTIGSMEDILDFTVIDNLYKRS